MNNVDFAHDIPRHWVNRIRSIRGVKCAEPYIVGGSIMTLPDGGFETVVIVGSDPTSLVGVPQNVVEGSPEDVRQADGIMIDVYDAEKIGNPQIGDLREIGGRRARVVARSKGIIGFLVSPYIFTSLEQAATYLAKQRDQCSYFLVQVEEGSDVTRIRSRIKQRIPEVEAFTSSEYGLRTIEYWLNRTGLGISFGASTLLGLLVGLVIVAQTLYASVLDRIGEFGTLKAVGANERQVYSIVLAQASMIAVVGAAVGLLLVSLVCTLFSTPRASIVVPWWLSVGSCVLVFVICLISSLLPYVRIRQIDPAMVLQN